MMLNKNINSVLRTMEKTLKDLESLIKAGEKRVSKQENNIVCRRVKEERIAARREKTTKKANDRATSKIVAAHGEASRAKLVRDNMRKLLGKDVQENKK